MTWRTNQEKQYKDMHNNLQGRTNKLKLRKQPAKELKQPIKQSTARKDDYTVNICEIGYAAFRINLKHLNNTLFSLSLYKLDRELKDRKQGQESKAKEPDLIN
jgi:aspartyl-tRNA synthetase